MIHQCIHSIHRKEGFPFPAEKTLSAGKRSCRDIGCALYGMLPRSRIGSSLHKGLCRRHHKSCWKRSPRLGGSLHGRRGLARLCSRDWTGCGRTLCRACLFPGSAFGDIRNRNFSLQFSDLKSAHSGIHSSSRWNFFFIHLTHSSILVRFGDCLRERFWVQFHLLRDRYSKIIE